jgi:uroporphyrinogen decarboxylase
MNAIERVQSVIDGRKPDRPPVSFWHHFPAHQVSGQAAVDAHVAQVEDYDLDFLKVMNDNGYPHAHRVASAADLAAISPLKGDEPNFVRQYDLLSDLKRRLRGRVPMTTTTFNAWATLRHLIRPSTGQGPPKLDALPEETSETIKRFYREDPSAVTGALQTIAANLGRFAAGCIEAGADGVFLSVRDDWLRSGDGADDLFERLIRPTDLQILSAASAGRFNMLHICGRPVKLGSFADYPVHVVNWADRAAGPSLADGCRIFSQAICAGVDNQVTLPSGSPEDCEREVRDALTQAGERPIMISPGCTFDPAAVPRANLVAVCRAARSA